MTALFLVAVTIVGLHYAILEDLPGTRSIGRWWHGHRRQAAAYVRASPATFLYLFVLLVTTVTLATSSPHVRELLLHERSTNLAHLRRDPVRVLVLSAFWTGSRLYLPLVVLFALVLAPAERWLGTPRTVVAFALGHVGATLVTAAGIAVAIHTGVASHRLAHVVDVGVSYGFACVAALLTYRLTSPWRYVWGAGALAIPTVMVLAHGSFTDYGHLSAVLVGFALYPLTRAPDVRERARGALLRVSSREA